MGITYPIVDILNRELTAKKMGIICPSGYIKSSPIGDKTTIGDYGFLSQVKKRKETNPKFDEISQFGDSKDPTGDFIPNWVFSSVSPLFSCQIENYQKYPQLAILWPIGDIKYLFGDNIPDQRLRISELGKAESENQSQIPNFK